MPKTSAAAVFAATMFIASISGFAQAGFANEDPIAKLLADGKLIVDVRHRHENLVHACFFESLKLNGRYHDRLSNQGSVDLASEIDIALSAKFPKGVSAPLKFANYNGSGLTADRQLIWL